MISEVQSRDALHWPEPEVRQKMTAEGPRGGCSAHGCQKAEREKEESGGQDIFPTGLSVGAHLLQPHATTCPQLPPVQQSFEMI